MITGGAGQDLVAVDCFDARASSSVTSALFLLPFVRYHRWWFQERNVYDLVTLKQHLGRIYSFSTSLDLLHAQNCGFRVQTTVLP